MLLLVALFVSVPTLAFAAAGDRGAALLPGATGLAEWLAVLPIILPLTGSALTLALRHSVPAQRWVTLAALSATAVAAAALAIAVAEEGVVVTVAGNWLPPFGIAIAVDPLGALFVLASAVTALAALAYAAGEAGDDDVRHGFYTFYCLLVAGVCGAFTTGDVFNLYVWFEVFLVASFGLMVVGGSALQYDGALKYGVLNLIATTIFLVAVGALYGVAGTLNMADLAGVLRAAPGGPVATIEALFVLGFAMKAAAVPLHMWLPASYHVPRVVVAALFAGLLTKIGVYSLIRVVVMLYGGGGFVPLILVIGIATAVVGALGAIAQADLKRMAAFLVVSGVGVMLIGIGLGGADGLAGTLAYAVNSMLAMTGLFLAIGYTERLAGSADLNSGTGLYALAPLAAALFLLFALAVAGVPPLSGFWPKVMLLQAALATGGAGGIAAAAAIVVSGFLTTVAAGRTWALVFLRPRAAGDLLPVPPGIAPGIIILAALVVLIGVLPQPLIAAAGAAARGVIDPAAYTRAVLGAG